MEPEADELAAGTILIIELILDDLYGAHTEMILEHINNQHEDWGVCSTRLIGEQPCLIHYEDDRTWIEVST